MKKVILAVAVLFSVAMVSCGGDKKAADTAAVDSPVVEESVSVVEESAVVEEVAPAAESAAAAAPAADSAAK